MYRAFRCSAWGGENLQHILKSCVEDPASVSDAFSPLSIESDLGISMLHVAHSRLADVLQSIHMAAVGQIWPAAAALEISWCLLDGVAAATNSSARSFPSSRHSAEALIVFCCRHPPLICQRLHLLIPPLIPYHKLLSENARIALCAAFVQWCDHELLSAVLDFSALGSKDCHMRVLQQAASANSAVWFHFVSHIAALQRQSPRSLFLTAFALSSAAFDADSFGINQHPLRCSSQMGQYASVTQHHRPSLMIAIKVQGTKRRALSCDAGENRINSKCEKGHKSRGGDGPDDAHELRCSYVSSLLCGLHAEISCVRSYMATNGDAFELLPLLHWLLAAEASNVIDGIGRIGLAQLEAIVCALLMDGRNTEKTDEMQAAPCSLLAAIVMVAASSICGRDDERLVSSAHASRCFFFNQTV